MPEEAIMQHYIDYPDQKEYGCDHSWPAELTSDAECEICGLLYKDWSN
jgi:hypothetical protein